MRLLRKSSLLLIISMIILVLFFLLFAYTRQGIFVYAPIESKASLTAEIADLKNEFSSALVGYYKGDISFIEATNLQKKLQERMSEFKQFKK